MTVIMPFGRILTRQILPRSNPLLTRITSSKPLLGAFNYESTNTTGLLLSQGRSDDLKILATARGYATTASKPVGRPKAHTGRNRATKSASQSKSTGSTKKPAAKSKSKAKSKTKPKKRVRKVATRKAQSKTAINRARVLKTKDLKTRALLDEPKPLPSNAWQIYFSTEQKKKTGAKTIAETAANTKEIAQRFKTLPGEEHEQLNHTANQNKAKNASEYEKWLSQHTPATVKDANNARKQLNKQAKAGGTRKKSSIRLIKDDRLVKQPRTAYTYFSVDRFASGDFKNMKVAESARLIGREWKALSSSERKTYEDQAKVDHDRYVEEYQTVYDKPPPTPRARKAS